MSQPSPESRISNLEKESMTLGARIEELASDTDGNFTEVKRLLKDKTDFEEMNEVLKAVATKDDISRLETQLDSMATKDDLTAMQGQIKQDTGTIETRLDRIEATQELILKLLQQK